MATHDYVIDNSTGANVRADINNVLQAILTNNSSSSAPSTTAAYMWWADTTSGTLKIRNSSDNAWVELLQLDGTLTLEDGSASTPALAFRDDLNTGIYSSAADKFNIATGGVERLELGSQTVFNEDGADVDFRIEGDTQENLFRIDAGNDRIGIRTSSPQTALDVNGSITVADSIIHSGDTNTFIQFPSNDNIQFNVNGSERLRIDDSDFVTVKHATTAKLRIQNSTAATSQVCMLDMAPAGTASGVQLKCVSDEDFSTGGNRTAHFRVDIRKDGTFATRLNIDNAGNVTIGSTATGRKLSVVDTSGAILELTSNTATATSSVYLHEGAIGSATNGGAIQYDGSSNCLKLTCGTTLTTEALRITRGDRFVGIGQGSSYNPAVPLEVRNPAGTTPTSGNFVLLRLCAQHNSARGLDIGTGRPTSGNQNDAGVFYNARDTEQSGYSAQHVFRRAGNNVMVIGYTGNNHVGIGTDSPDYTLDVEQGGGTTSPTALARFRQTTNDDTDSATIMIMRHAAALSGQNGVDIIFQNNGGTAVGKIDHGQSTTQYRTSSDYRLKENAVAISDGITRLKTLKPYRFNFIAEPDRTVDGFFAHEVTAVPEAISGTKDEVETTYYQNGDDIPEGKAVGDVKSTTSPVYQGIDHSKLVPLLTAALQEAVGKIEVLETKVAALEAA